MNDVPAFGLANTVTGFATLGAGVMCLLLTWTTRPHPRAWVGVYWTIVVTGLFTITLHGFGETVPWGRRHLWSLLDTGSNLIVSWAITLAVLADYYDSPATRRNVGLTATAAMLLGWWFLWRLPGDPAQRTYLIPLGAFGGFHGGEFMLICLSWLVAALFYIRRARIPAAALPGLWLVLAIFFCGMLLATASNDQIGYPFFAYHALWHIVGAFGFVAFWVFNHTRFAETSQREGSLDA